MKNKLVHSEIFIFDLSKVFKTMNIHFKTFHVVIKIVDVTFILGNMRGSGRFCQRWSNFDIFS